MFTLRLFSPLAGLTLLGGLAASSLGACASTPAAPAVVTQEDGRADGLADLRIEVSVELLEGDLMVVLFDSKETYDANKPVRAFKAAVDESPIVFSAAGLKPGTYAAKAFHDLDRDGELNTNAFGIPTEPYAFSNNAPARFGPAGFDKAAFEVPAGASVTTLSIK